MVLAAGEGTRMRSSRPKPLHRLCGRPMILHVLDTLAELPVHKVVVVVGHRGDWVTKTLVDHAPRSLAIEFVEQSTQLGTGDALAVGLTALPDGLVDADGDVVVLPGDTPLVRPPTLAALVRHHRNTGAAATLLTAVLPDPTGYDRVVRGKNDAVVRVVEAADVRADDAFVDEVATTIHCFRHTVLAPALRRLRPVVRTGEHCLTGIYAVLHDAGYGVETLVVGDPMEAAGVNDRAQLAVADAELRDRINERWMRRGVTMWDPENTYIDANAAPRARRGPAARCGHPGRMHSGRRGRDRARLPCRRQHHRCRCQGHQEHGAAGRDRRGRPGRAVLRARARRPRRGGRGGGPVHPVGGGLPGPRLIPAAIGDRAADDVSSSGR